MSSIDGSEALLHHDELPLPVELRRVRGARRLRLRIDQGRAVLKLSGPLRMNRKAALAWAVEQAEWVRAQLEALLPDEPFVPGAVIPIEGSDTLLVWSQSAPRRPSLGEGLLTVGGPLEGFSRRVQIHLERLALDTLSRETAAIAVLEDLCVRSVAVGDPDTRWGSCSSAARIRYSWRLILAPPQVRRFVVAHEVAHLRHLDHGPQFKALERRLFGGDTAAARALLRRIGPRLKRIGRGR